ncbi:RDD family protein [Oerskovia sp. NPDC057915]|uniref:RDD family protein n=1 Tax=Oerskovia sp. NPDC057915 TaxID=3346280 RepID=UPI0036DC4AD6
MGDPATTPAPHDGAHHEPVPATVGASATDPATGDGDPPSGPGAPGDTPSAAVPAYGFAEPAAQSAAAAPAAPDAPAAPSRHGPTVPAGQAPAARADRTPVLPPGRTPSLPPDLTDLDDPPLFGPYASWLRRVGAFLLDNSILAGLMFVVVGPGVAPSALPGLDNNGSMGTAFEGVTWSESAWMIGAVLAMVVLQAYTGATPGKRAVGIVVVNRDSGRPVGFLTTVLRWLAHLLDALCFVGYLRPLWDRQHRTFADSLLSTVVVRSVAPEPHAWLAPFVRERHRGSRVVTAAATVLCVAGLAYAYGPTTTRGGQFVSATACTAWEHGSRPDVPQFSEASFSRTTPGTITRLGVTHPLPDEGLGSEITLTWDGEVPASAGASLEAVLTGPDGTRLEYSTPLGTGFGEVGASPTSPGVIEIPANDLRDVGAGWTWIAQMRVDGVATPGCGGQVPS